MPTADDRFFAKVHITDGCWLWTARRMKNGYGSFRVGSLLDGTRKNVLAHRYAYEQMVGPIPEGLVVDHTCHNADPECVGGFGCVHRACVNPAHLAATTYRQNVLAGKTIVAAHAAQRACVHGHDFSPENTYHDPRNPHTRACRECHRRIAREQGRRKRAA